MKEIVSDPALVAYCGLYCGACRRYLKDRCPGCHEYYKAAWCKLRTCCMKNGYASCADCTESEDPMACRKFNNFISKIFGFIFRSDRNACIRKIKEIGIQGHADEMSRLKMLSLKRD
jgi:hypothetical protein